MIHSSVVAGGETRGYEGGEFVEPGALAGGGHGEGGRGKIGGRAADPLEEPLAGGERPRLLSWDCPGVAADLDPAGVRQEIVVAEEAAALVVDRRAVLVEVGGEARERGEGGGPARVAFGS